MARAVYSLTASPTFCASLNAKMSKKEKIVQTYHQTTTDTKPLVVADASLKENDISNTETETEIYDPHHRRTLFVRFPHRIKDKLEVKLLYPGIEAVRFKPRIKRWCHIRFSSEETAKCALKDLHKKRVKGGRLIVTETKKFKINNYENKTKKKPRFYKLYVKNLPEDATENEITSAFPGCVNIRMITPKKRGSLGALLGFKTVDKMEAIVSSTKVHKVRDRDVSVSYSKTYLQAHALLKQEQQKSNNRIEIPKDLPPKSVSTSAFPPKNEVSYTRKRKTSVTSEYLGKMIEASLSQFKTEDDGNDSGEDDRYKEGTEMDTQDSADFDDDTGDNSDDFSQYKAIKLEDEVTSDGGDSNDFSKYKEIQLDDEVNNGTNDDDDSYDDFSKYKSIEMEGEETKSIEEEDDGNDFSKYKEIELEDEATKTSCDDDDDDDDDGSGGNCVDDDRHCGVSSNGSDGGGDDNSIVDSDGNSSVHEEIVGESLDDDDENTEFHHSNL